METASRRSPALTGIDWLARKAAELECRLSVHIAWLAVPCGIFYIASTVARDIRRPLWFDEIFTRYISRLDSPGLIWKALTGAADGQPFPFFAIAHYSQRLFGDNAFAIRFPETLGFALMCVCIYIFTRRRTDPLCAIGAALMPLATGAAYYATEGRPYGLELGFCGLILVCWQAAAEFRHRAFVITGLALGVAGAVSSHYLAVLLLIPIGIGELVRTRINRRWDLPIWAAMLVGLTPLVAYLPAMRAIHVYAAGFWAHPTFASFRECYTSLFEPAYLPLLVVAAAGLVVGRGRGGERATPAMPLHESAAIAAFMLLPVYQLALSHFTGVLLARYTIGTIAGAAILCGVGFYRLGRSFTSIGLVFSLCMFAVFVKRELTNISPSESRNENILTPILTRTAATGLPLVAGDPIQFLESQARMDAGLNQRLWYIADAEEIQRATGEDSEDIELLRLRLRAPIHVMAPGQFLSSHRSFLLVQDGAAKQRWLMSYLISRGASVKLQSRDGTLFVFRVDLDRP